VNPVSRPGDAVLADPVTVGRDHIRGAADAPVTLLEYGDYECGFCAAAHRIVVTIEAALGSRLRFVFRHFPLTTVHPHAQLAAEAAEAAGAQNEFWTMHGILFRSQRDLRPKSLARYAQDLELDLAAFSKDLIEHTHLPKVRADFAGGIMSGVNGTPTFYINGVRHDGAWDYPALSAATLSAALRVPARPMRAG
jgi:protein-disulfide isomerase